MSADPPANGQTPVLELKGLSKSFGGLHAVRGVTFKIMPGDRKAIIGPNGAGKTTLFNLITGIFPASAGQVLLFGQDVTGLAEPPAHGARHGAHLSGDQPVPAPDRARQRAAGDQGAAAVEVRDVAVHVVVPRGLRQGAPAARTGGLHGPREHRSTLPFARRTTAVRDRAWAGERPEDPSSRRTGGGSVLGRIRRDDQVLDGARPEARDPPDRARHGRGVRRGRQISVLHFGEVLETGAPEQIKNSQKVQEIYLGTG